jgi:hypothetical protein
MSGEQDESESETSDVGNWGSWMSDAFAALRPREPCSMRSDELESVPALERLLFGSQNANMPEGDDTSSQDEGGFGISKIEP